MKVTKMLKVNRWEDIDWKAVEQSIFRKQNQMYRATLASNITEVRRLQRDLLKDPYARLLSVKRVTFENTGKYTPGVDGAIILKNPDRLLLAQKMNLDKDYKAKPLKRIYIPKSNGKLRPLGIPTIEDRAYQALVKIALEPEWEAKFSENTYGFRPGRCTADACMAVWHNLKNRKGEVVVLDADIEGCFDNLNHQYILDAMKGTSSNILRAVNQWFKCGYVDDGILHDTEAGTPQGGVISPLLCNIGLWGIDFEIYNHLITTRTPKDRNLKPFVSFVSNIKKRCREHAPSVGFMQYADDFVIVCENKDYLDRVMEVLPQILEKRGLKLSPSKTRKVEFYKGESFKFLGFVFDKWKSGKHDKLYKVTFYPDPDKVYAFAKKIREWTKMVRLFEYSNQLELTKKADYLRRMVNGWLNYYKWAIDASHGFMKLRWELDTILYKAYEDVHKHRSSRHDFMKRYVGKVERRGRLVDRFILGNVAFGIFDISTDVLWKKVQTARSPFDGDTEYWSCRNAILTGTVSEKLYKIQKGNCAICTSKLHWYESWERHHKNKNRMDNKLSNIQLVHKRCHRKQHHADKLRLGAGCPERGTSRSVGKVEGRPLTSP
ncbi:reverse transcriptase domain-containing protein [Mucilaginibacter gilvus]|uniref:Reverse transcriptase domain-containing protein n=1 Tax=Mucilaginibacter gilvus TaxID=2305909 RepID=A0A3S4Y4V7_9SPHI|nr:reverse transcriptase domain-containing protein [Mucilaginibacter gilvus]RWY47485.1 hypothetical protein EPL05_21740 [Mucilaginibacter gilvus]